MVRQFEPGRAVEITSPKYGSGYRLGGRLLLTAAHLVNEAGSDCRVRAKQNFGEVEATVVWKAKGWDVALIELPASVPLCDPVVLGQLPEGKTGEKLEFQMYGYPRWGRTQRDAGKPAAGGRQIEGVTYLADRSPDDLLVLEPQRLPPEVTTEGSEWEGASGAAIICNGLVIAVQSWHQNPKRSASLEASPLWAVYSDHQWCDLLERHGINPEPEVIHIPISLHNWKLQALLQIVGGALGAGIAVGSLRAAIAPVLYQQPFIQFLINFLAAAWLGIALTVGMILAEKFEQPNRRKFPWYVIVAGGVCFWFAHLMWALVFSSSLGKAPLVSPLGLVAGLGLSLVLHDLRQIKPQKSAFASLPCWIVRLIFIASIFAWIQRLFIWAGNKGTGLVIAGTSNFYESKLSRYADSAPWKALMEHYPRWFDTLAVIDAGLVSMTLVIGIGCFGWQKITPCLPTIYRWFSR